VNDQRVDEMADAILRVVTIHDDLTVVAQFAGMRVHRWVLDELLAVQTALDHLFREHPLAATYPDGTAPHWPLTPRQVNYLADLAQRDERR